jgi:hypothetical protein
MHGQGKMKYPDGESRKGTFINGIEDGVSIAKLPDGEKLRIVMKNGK